MSTPPRWKLKSSELSGEEVRNIIRYIEQSPEPDKNVYLTNIITEVFNAHIEKVRKPFEQYDPDATPSTWRASSAMASRSRPR